MNNFLPDEDRDLVDFIKRHRPLPSEASSYLETQIMASIEREPQGSTTTKKKLGILWAIPGTIAMGLVITWNGQRLSETTPQFARDIEALESFLITNWEATIDESYFSVTTEPELYQLLSTVESPQVISTNALK